MIASFVEENHENWDQFLHEFAFALRTAVNETTNKTPAELFLGRKIITPFSKLINVTEDAKYVGNNIERLFDEARRNMQKQHRSWEKHYNLRRRDVHIKVRVYRPRQSDTISSDSPIETLYDEQEVSHGSNRSHQGQFKEHRKTSSQENPDKDLIIRTGKDTLLSKGRESRGRSLPRSRPGLTKKKKKPNTSSPGIQSITGPSKLPDRRNATTTSGSRMEVSGRDNQTRQTRATTRRHNEQAEKTVRSNQTNTRRPCPYYLRSRIQEKTESMRTSTTSKSTAYLAAYSAEEASVWKR
ncbi:uncharacterized protein TNCV_366451 [Trichonephila clavipes]|nr:uncharacterized protein TNCV_366451 [Trichonephila clavipes]